MDSMFININYSMGAINSNNYFLSFFIEFLFCFTVAGVLCYLRVPLNKNEQKSIIAIWNNAVLKHSM